MFCSCLFFEFVCSFFSLSAVGLPFFFQCTIGTPPATEVTTRGLRKVNFAFRTPDKNRFLSRNIIDSIVQICPFSVFRICIFFEFVSR